MTWLIISAVLFVLNLWIGIHDVKNGKSLKMTAFTWFVVGWLAFDVISQLGKVLTN